MQYADWGERSVRWAGTRSEVVERLQPWEMPETYVEAVGQWLAGGDARPPAMQPRDTT